MGGAVSHASLPVSLSTRAVSRFALLLAYRNGNELVEGALHVPQPESEFTFGHATVNQR
jgi:hypothetical protein